MSQHDTQPATTVAWFKHGPYSDGEELQCVFEDPNDDINYSALIFKDPELRTTQPAQVHQQSDPAGIMQMVDTLIASVNEAHHASSEGWRDACFQSADRVREKIKDAVTALTEQGAGEVVAWTSVNDALPDTQPAAGADVLDAVSPVGDWSYSHDEERFSGQFDTKEAAIAEGLSCGARFVGQVNHVRDIISDGQIGWDIYERIGEILGDEIGEVAECFTLSPDQQEVLGKVVLDWIESGPGFNCWGIKDVEPIDAAIAASGRQE